MKYSLLLATALCTFLACSNNSSNKPVLRSLGYSKGKVPEGVPLVLPEEGLLSRPAPMLRTAHAAHRLLPVFKLRMNPYNEKYYIGGTQFHRAYGQHRHDSTNAWHRHLIPGLEAIHGTDLLNLAHFNLETNQRTTFFQRPVLINTVYYPCIDQDTLKGNPVERDFYLVSVYDEDTNGDSLINRKDLRRLYHYNLDGVQLSRLIPANYSVQSSQYDQDNDMMVIVARLDEDEDGKRDVEEPIHVFWLNLADIKAAERMY